MGKERKRVRMRPRGAEGQLIARSNADKTFFCGKISVVERDGLHIRIYYSVDGPSSSTSRSRTRLLCPEEGKIDEAIAFIEASRHSCVAHAVVNKAYLANLIRPNTKTVRKQRFRYSPATQMWDGGNMRVKVESPKGRPTKKVRVKNDVLDASVNVNVQPEHAEAIKAAFLNAWAAIPRAELPRAIKEEWIARVNEILLACAREIDSRVGMLSKRHAAKHAVSTYPEKKSAEFAADAPEMRSKKKQRCPFVPGAVVGRARRSWAAERDAAYLRTFHHKAIPALADGNCFYDAIALLLRDGRDHAAIRALGVNYLSEHLQEMAPGLTDKEAQTCLSKACRNGEYVDHIMIASVSRALEKNIVILYSDQRKPLIQRHQEGDDAALQAGDTLVVYYYVPEHYEPVVPIVGQEVAAYSWLAELNTSPTVRIARDMPNVRDAGVITAAFQQLRQGNPSAASGVISSSDQELFLSADTLWDQHLRLINSCKNGKSYSAEKYARCCSYLYKVLAMYQRLFETYGVDLLQTEVAEVRAAIEAVLEKRERIFSSSIGDDVLGEEGVNIQNWPRIEKHFARGVRFFPEKTNPGGLRCVPHAQLPGQLGLRATQVIPVGTLIATYAGVPCADSGQESPRYFFGHAEGGGGVDASRVCNVAVLANHSAVNNCQAVCISDKQFQIIAAREIRPGEEVLYSYGPHYAFDGQPAFINPYLGAHSPKWIYEEHKAQYKEHNSRLWPELYLACLRNELARGEVLPMLPLLEIDGENKFDAKIAQPCISPLHIKDVYRDEDCVRRFLAAGLPGDWLDINSGTTPAFRVLADRELGKDKKYALLQILLVTNRDQLLLQDREGNSILGLCIQLGLSDCLEWCIDQIKKYFDEFHTKILCKIFFDPSHRGKIFSREDGEDSDRIKVRYEQFVTQMTTGSSQAAKGFRSYEIPEDTVQIMRNKETWDAFNVLRPPLNRRAISTLPKDHIEIFLAADEAWNKYEKLWELYKSDAEDKPDIKDINALLARSKAGYAQLHEFYPHIKELGDEVHEVEQAQRRVATCTASSDMGVRDGLPVITPTLASMDALKRPRLGRAKGSIGP